MTVGTLPAMGVSWGGDKKRAKTVSRARAVKHETPADAVIDLRDAPSEVDIDDFAVAEPAPAT
jgi:hypothetical protein